MSDLIQAETGGCSPGEILGVLPTFVFAFALLHALLVPLAGFSRGFVESVEVAFYIEAVVLVPLAVFGPALFGERRRANIIGSAVGAVVTAAWLVFGSAAFALMAGLQLGTRVSSLGGEGPPSRREMDGWREIIANRWMVQFFIFVVALVIGSNMSGLRFGFTPSARRELLAAGLAPDCLIDAVTMLAAGFLYFFFTGVNSFFRLPCMRRGREADIEADRLFFARFVAAGRVPPPSAPAAPVPPPRQSLERLEAALATPEGAQGLLLRLASGAGEIPVGRFLLIADAALQRVRDAGDPVRSRTIGLLAGTIGADARITPMEFALHVLARKRLGAAAGARPAGTSPDLASFGAECGTLLALVARGGDAEGARARGRAYLGLTDAIAPAPNALTLQGVTAALDRLATLDSRGRAMVVNACLVAAAPPNEALSALLFAIGTALDSPVPANLNVG